MAKNVAKAVLQYETLLNDVLRERLRKSIEARQKVYEEISEYAQLQSQIEQIQEDNLTSLHTQVDLGCNFYCQAKVPDTSKIFVRVGYGFFVEFTLEEALKFIEKKTKHLYSVADRWKEVEAEINIDMIFVTETLRKLQGFSDIDETAFRDMLM